MRMLILRKELPSADAIGEDFETIKIQLPDLTLEDKNIEEGENNEHDLKNYKRTRYKAKQQETMSQVKKLSMVRNNNMMINIQIMGKNNHMMVDILLRGKNNLTLVTILTKGRNQDNCMKLHVWEEIKKNCMPFAT